MKLAVIRTRSIVTLEYLSLQYYYITIAITYITYYFLINSVIFLINPIQNSNLLLQSKSSFKNQNIIYNSNFLFYHSNYLNVVAQTFYTKNLSSRIFRKCSFSFTLFEPLFLKLLFSSALTSSFFLKLQTACGCFIYNQLVHVLSVIIKCMYVLSQVKYKFFLLFSLIKKIRDNF